MWLLFGSSSENLQRRLRLSTVVGVVGVVLGLLPSSLIGMSRSSSAQPLLGMTSVAPSTDPEA